jgi:uncharacterized membrane protein
MSDREPRRNEASPKTVMGIPVNFDWRNWNRGFWNADDHRLFPPKRVGVGWTINLREVLYRLGLIQ